jgi:hypothetical protein
MPPLRRLFLKTELEPRLAEARRGQRTVLFVDAAHFVLSAFLGWVWCAARLFVRGASGRQRYNVLGALDPLTQTLIRVSNHTYINSLLAWQVNEILLPSCITGHWPQSEIIHVRT